MSLRAIAGATLGVCLLLGVSTSAHAVTLNPYNSIEDPILTNTTADHAPYNISASPYVWGALFQNTDSAGSAVFQFKNDTANNSLVTMSIGTVLQGIGGLFTGGVTASWIGVASMFIPEGKAGIFDISKVLKAGEIATLKIDFGTPVAYGDSAPGIQLQVGANMGGGGVPGPSPVPLPAPFLLLLTGIAGLGYLGRKKASH